MKSSSRSFERGQAKVEYALLLALIALLVIAALALLGPQLAAIFEGALNSLPTTPGNGLTPVEALAQDFLQRIQDFYAQNGRWPRSWGNFRFTDLGLDPKDWKDPVEGLSWNPNGDKIGLANVNGDNLQVYVNDLEGNTLHLYDGWNIWCTTSGACYYHTVAPGNEVDLGTLVVVDTQNNASQNEQK